MKRSLYLTLMVVFGLTAAYVTADVKCKDLRHCSGGGLCIGPASVDGCDLECTSGSVQCISIEVY
jgi:hypothetical protein